MRNLWGVQKNAALTFNYKMAQARARTIRKGPKMGKTKELNSTTSQVGLFKKMWVDTLIKGYTIYTGPADLESLKETYPEQGFLIKTIYFL